MKNLYHKNKGKVHPSPSSPSSLTPKPNPDSALSLLNFLPATILTLASILSLEDREVLAYLITTNPSSMIEEKKKKFKNPKTLHKPPIFECGCFECYTSYWFRWDSSPNRELIHQVIEAFEDHLTHQGERNNKKSGNNRGKKKDKVFDKTPKELETIVPVVLEMEPEEVENEVSPQSEVVVGEWEEMVPEMVAGNVTEEEMVQVFPVDCNQHKGLARKVLPDVMGLFNSRIWNLWSTNI